MTSGEKMVWASAFNMEFERCRQALKPSQREDSVFIEAVAIDAAEYAASVLKRLREAQDEILDVENKFVGQCCKAILEGP